MESALSNLILDNAADLANELVGSDTSKCTCFCPPDGASFVNW